MAKNPFDDLLDTAPSAPANPFDDLLDGGQQQQGPGFGARALHAIGSVLDRLGPAELRGAAQGAQDYQPQDEGFSGRNVGGVLGSMAKGAWDGLINPDRVQSAQTQYARMGVSDAPSSRLNVMGTSGQPMNLGQDRPAGDPSLAATLGAAQDMLAPLPPVGLALKGAAKGAGQVAKASEKIGVSAAERAILEHYNPTLMKELAPDISGSATIADAPAIVAQKLREHDLLYAPGKANFNLKRDLKQTGEKIGSVIQEAKQKDVAINVQKVVDDFMASKQKALSETGEGAASFADLQKEIAPRIQAMVDQLKPNELGEVPIDKAVNFRRSLQDMVKNWGEQGGKPIIQGAAKDLQSSLNQAIEASDPRLGPKLAGLNNKFSDLKDLQPLIEDAYTRGFGKSAGGKVAQSGLAKALDAVIGENGKPLVKSALRAAASPVKTVLGIKPEWAEALANRNSFPYPDMYASEPLSNVPANITAPPPPDAAPGLPPRQPITARRPLNPPPASPVPAPAPQGLHPRQSSYSYPARRPLSPIAEDPSLSVEQLGKVLDADAAKEIASTQYQSDRLKVLWKKVQEAQTPKQKSALMNLIRAVHNSTKEK